VAAEAVTLMVLSEERITRLTVGLKRTRGRRNGEALSHGEFS
jgi:hypothetical protein